jgi:hypothetical protein
MASTSGGLVFTNNKGQVIFADSSFLDIMKFERRQPVMGKPLYRVLGIEQEEIKGLLTAEPGISRPVVMTLRDCEGRVNCLELESIPAYDRNDKFLGINIIVRKVSDGGAALPVPVSNIGTRPLSLRLVEQTPGEILQPFFLAQVDTLQIVLARVAGLRVRDALESIFNDAAQKHTWAAAMVDGNVYVDPSAANPDVYRELLCALAEYAAVVIGWKFVSHEMMVTEYQFGPSTLDMATDCGLRAVYVAREHD